MAIWTNTPVRPNQQLQAGPVDALAIEKFLGLVEGTLQRVSLLRGVVDLISVRGTNTITKKAIGEATLTTIVPGEAPDGVAADFSKNSLKVDKHILARSIVAELEMFQTDFNVQAKIADEQGKKLAKFFDQAMLIQMIKAAMLPSSAYGSVDGFLGGSVETLGLAGDVTDPSKLYAAFGSLTATIRGKDVDPNMDGLVAYCRPSVIKTLLEAEQIINGEYVTADGTTMKGYHFAAWGIPVKTTNDIPNSVVSGHLLGSAYNGDFTKVVALVASPKSIMAGETIGLTAEVFRHPIDKQTYIDTHTAFGATPDRAEYAGVILLP